MLRRRHPGIERAVVVTGASSGIGRACSLRLTRLGFRVFAGVRKKEDGEALANGAPDNLVPLRIDVEDTASLEAAVEFVGRSLPSGTRLWGLVNNAGITVSGPLEFVPLDEFRRVLGVNVVGQLAVTQAFLPLVRRGPGRIVNMGSFNGRVAAPFIGPYCASKFALAGMTDALRVELAPWGIRVSLVEPGSIDTDIWRKYEAYTDHMVAVLPERFHDLYGRAMGAALQAAKRRAASGISPEEVARAVEHALLSGRPKTRYLVGWDAWLGNVLARFLPEWVLDEAIVRYMKLPRKP